MSLRQLKPVQVIRLPNKTIKMWITRNKGRLAPYLVWLYEPTFINKRYWVIDTKGCICPVMMIEMIDWPEDWPNLKRGEKMHVNLTEVKK